MKCMTEFRNGGPMWPICSCLSTYVRCFVGLRLKQRLPWKGQLGRQWRRRINWPKVGIHNSHIHIFQVIPSAFKLHQTAHHLQISIPLLSEIAGHLFEPCPADPQILLWCKRILAAIYWPNIQQYPAISSYTRFPAQNLAMQCPLQAPIENSILYVVWWGTMCS